VVVVDSVKMGVVVGVVSLVVNDSGGHVVSVVVVDSVAVVVSGGQLVSVIVVVSVVVEGGLQYLNLYPIIIELIESTLKLPDKVAIEKSVPVGW
jgi:hypothetical protein